MAAAWAAVVTAVVLVRVDHLGNQRVHVRWSTETTDASRVVLEQQLGLEAREPRGERTSSYRLRDRSSAAIQQIVTHPQVEDTAHLDRSRFRLLLDRPDLSPAVRDFLERDLLAPVTAGLAVIALFVTWRHRISLVHLGRAVATRAPKAGALIITELRVACAGRRRSYLGRLAAWISQPGSVLTQPTSREYAIGIALGVLFLVPLLIYGPYEEEIVQATVFPNQVFYRALVHGEWIYWLNNLGFGTPFPIGDPFLFHPVFGPLAAFTSTRVTLSGLWLAHVVVAVVYFLRLSALIGIRTRLRFLLLVTYLGSVVSMTYLYDNDWIQMTMTWTLYPVVLFYLHDAIERGAEERFWLTAIRLAIVISFWIVNSHPGHVAPLALIAAVYVLASARFRTALVACLGVTVVLVGIVVLPRLYLILREMRMFPGIDAQRTSHTVWSYIVGYLGTADPRGPFLGFGFGVAALAAAFRVHRETSRYVRGCVAAFVVAMLCTLLPTDVSSRVLPGLSPWLLRDGVILFGLLMAGYTLQRWFDRGHTWAIVALVLLLVQLVHQGLLVTGPSMYEVARREGRLLFYRYQGTAVGLVKMLVDQSSDFGPRVYLSPTVDRLSRGRLSPDGLHFSSDLALIGLNPVNGWFKNVSMEALQPAPTFMEGYIAGEPDMAADQTLLDVLGINVVMMLADELPATSPLKVVGRYRPRTDVRSDIIVLGNPQAWPTAVLLDRDAHRVELPVKAGCGHDRALCRDYSPLAAARLDGVVELATSNGRYSARFTASDQPRVLFLSVLYRPEWEAMAGGEPLAVHTVAGAFVGVTVPAGVTEVTVTYRPRLLMAMTWTSNATFGGLLLCFAALWFRQRPV